MLEIPFRSVLRRNPLVTSRLALAPLEGVDADDLWNAVDGSRADLEPWLPWVPFNVDLETSVRYAELSAQDWDEGRACRFSIRRRDNRRLLGVVGLEQLVHLHRSADLGYWLRTDSTKSGFMSEAAERVLVFAFESLRVHRVRVAAATGNASSLAVIRRAGFRFEGVAREAEFVRGRWLDHAVFSLLKRDRSEARPATASAPLDRTEVEDLPTP